MAIQDDFYQTFLEIIVENSDKIRDAGLDDWNGGDFKSHDWLLSPPDFRSNPERVIRTATQLIGFDLAHLLYQEIDSERYIPFLEGESKLPSCWPYEMRVLEGIPSVERWITIRKTILTELVDLSPQTMNVIELRFYQWLAQSIELVAIQYAQYEQTPDPKLLQEWNPKALKKAAKKAFAQK